MPKRWLSLLVAFAGLAGCATPEPSVAECFPGPCAATIELSLSGFVSEGATLTAEFVPKVDSQAYANDFYAGVWLPESLRLVSGSLEFRGPAKAGERITLQADIVGPGIHEVRAFATYTETSVGAPSATELRAFEVSGSEVHPKELNAPDFSISMQFLTNNSFEVLIAPSLALNYSADLAVSSDFSIEATDASGHAEKPTSVLVGKVNLDRSLPNGQHHVAFVLVDVSPYATPSRVQVAIAALVEDSEIVRLIESRTSDPATAPGDATP